MATPTAGYRFVKWTEGGLIVSTIPGFSITVDRDRALRANFIMQFNIETVSSPTIGGSTSGSGIYDINTNAPLTATPSIGSITGSWFLVLRSLKHSELVLINRCTIRI